MVVFGDFGWSVGIAGDGARRCAAGESVLFDATALRSSGGGKKLPDVCPVGRCLLRCVLSILAVIHLLLASWVYADIRKRGEGHGIFIVLVLLGGIPSAILYALVRIGDKKS